jgi:nitrogen fixation/metabolism regulation signal transduction histidine kinase
MSLGRSFRLNVALRVALLAALMAGAAAAGFGAGMWLVATALALAAVGAALSLVRYAERTEREVTRLLEAARYGDTAQSFSAASGEEASALGEALEGMMADVRAARTEAQEQARTLATIVQHVGTGLVAFRSDGCVTLLNGAAKRFLGLTHLRQIEHLGEHRPEAAAIAAIPPGERVLLRLSETAGEGGERGATSARHLLASATSYSLRGQAYTLVALQDIGAELDAHEADAWQKLTRVLTHEIMNSVTPIASLSATVRDLLDGPLGGGDSLDGGDAGGGLSEEARADVQSALATIARRSGGLLRFVEAYRSLARMPQPRYALLPAEELLKPLETLLGPDLSQRGIALETRAEPPGLRVTADAALLEQVLINLVQNAADGVAERFRGEPGGRIRVEVAQSGRGHTLVRVRDNGAGIEAEALEQVFIPFFTTKPQGSGVGLAFARQVMRMHGGTITATSERGEQTTFTLRF